MTITKKEKRIEFLYIIEVQFVLIQTTLLQV